MVYWLWRKVKNFLSIWQPNWYQTLYESFSQTPSFNSNYYCPVAPKRISLQFGVTGQQLLVLLGLSPSPSYIPHENAMSTITLTPTLALSFLTRSLRFIDNSLRNIAERSFTYNVWLYTLKLSVNRSAATPATSPHAAIKRCSLSGVSSCD